MSAANRKRVNDAISQNSDGLVGFGFTPSPLGLVPALSTAPVTALAASLADGRAAASTQAPTDPLYASQWHLAQLGNIEAIWNEFGGRHVSVGIYDDGVEYTHADLDANYDSSLHVIVGGITFDGVNAAGEPHGTSVAGLIAAEGNNGAGGIGVAYRSTITGVNIFDPSSPLFINAADFTPFIQALEQADNFDVVNNSWGSTPGFFASQNVNISGSFAQRVVSAWETVIDNGRGGLGTIVVKSAGNEARNSNGESSNSSRYTITVAALQNDGISQAGNAFASSYSNHGADVLVTAGAGDLSSVSGSLGIVTTDLLGTNGYNLRSDPAGFHDYTDDFGGTSAAAPIVTGVVAVMLEANANLGWRDVQELLSLGATHTGSAIGATSLGANENGLWFVNGGSDWNGGGRHFSVNYGYGVANIYNSVRMAEAYKLFDTAPRASANEVTITASNNAGGALPDLSTVNIPVTATSLEIEHVTVTVTLTHSFFTDLNIFLVAPDGTTVMLADGTAGSSSSSDSALTWSFGADSFRGMDAAGQWTVRIADVISADAGSWSSVRLDFFGSETSANDYYHFTDEFSEMVALDPSRSAIIDGNGGVDWLNLAAVTSANTVNLTTNSGSADGVAISFGGIENIVSGDGADTLTGDANGNIIAGGRGRDLLAGMGGADHFAYVSRYDSLGGGASRDRITDFNKANDFIDLSAVDTRLAEGDQSFKYIGSHEFGKQIGQLRFEIFDKKGTAHDLTLIEGNFDKDKAAEFQIELSGIHKLKEADFLL